VAWLPNSRGLGPSPEHTHALPLAAALTACGVAVGSKPRIGCANIFLKTCNIAFGPRKGDFNL
jgi:hypothetical protein